MNELEFDEVMREAKAALILPASATRPQHEERPWPVVVLTAFGAWLAAIPLILMVGTLLGDLINKGVAAYLVGILLLIATVVTLRARNVPLFVEQLAVPALLVGGVTLGIGLFRDLPGQAAAALLALTAATLAWFIPRIWLRVLLGAAMSALATVAFIPNAAQGFGGDRFDFWIALHICITLWITTQFLLDKGKLVRFAQALESLATGWVLVTLVGLAVWSGMTFMAGASVGLSGGADSNPANADTWPIAPLSAVSVVFAMCAAVWLGHRWPSVRQAWIAGVALVFISLAWLMPSLGACLLILSMCGASKRWRLAAAAALSCAWIMGSFYYQLNYPLATKAFMLAGAGAVLGTLAWFALRTSEQIEAQSPGAKPTTPRGTQIGIAVSVLAVLMVANAGIWQKEDLIAHSRPVFVELAPVDPRSLMQGDYMQLSFKLPEEVHAEARFMRGGGRPRVVAALNAQGIAAAKRLDNGSALAKDEILIELTSTRQGWTLVTDAWYFREGEAERWSRAKYGEFRVGADGRALLVGMRGPALEPL